MPTTLVLSNIRWQKCRKSRKPPAWLYRMVRFTLLARNNTKYKISGNCIDLNGWSSVFTKLKVSKSACFCFPPVKFQHARQQSTNQTRALEFLRKLAERLLTHEAQTATARRKAALRGSAAERRRRHLPMCARNAFHVRTHQKLSWIRSAAVTLPAASRSRWPDAFRGGHPRVWIRFWGTVAGLRATRVCFPCCCFCSSCVSPPV